MGCDLLIQHITQKMRTEIERGAPFGLTPTGADWCVKALHPSDPLTEVRGIPDHSAIPTVCLNYQSVFTLTCAQGETTPWSFDLTMLPHPYYIAAWDGAKAYCPESAVHTHGNFWNSQLLAAQGQPADVALYTAWTQLALRWRLAYQSVTVYQDGPDLANQGTIVVSQAPVTPMMIGGPSLINPAGQLVTGCQIAMFNPAEEGPDFTRSQAMPNAMMGKSKEGAYAPLKLTDTVQDWHSTRDDHMVMEQNQLGGNDQGFTAVRGTLLPVWPFYSVMPANYVSAANFTGNRVVDMLQNNVCHISARNLANTTSYTFHFRMGIEAQLAPSSTLTPQLKLSPPYDPRALDTYFKLSRELKDGYPCDYNDLGKMWDAISGAVKTLRPALNMVFPGLGSFAGGVSDLGDSIRSRRKARRQLMVSKNDLTQANLERMQDLRAVGNIVNTMPNPRRRQKGRAQIVQAQQPILVETVQAAQPAQAQQAILVEPSKTIPLSGKASTLRVVRTMRTAAV